MAGAPNLVIQLQRMGDLVLSFPLFSWLAAQEPDHPVWVVAEPDFFQALMPLAPSVVFFPPHAEPELRTAQYHRIINLSHRPEAARLAANLQAAHYSGYWERPDTERRVLGNWHLYRASLVHNNRHNHLHWADLNALDVIKTSIMQRSLWPVLRQPASPRVSGRIGLFVGASESAKRPDPAFWATLAKQLMRRGCRPVFLGGEKEAPLGAEAARLANLPLGNLCGMFSLAELTHFVAELDLLVTPDTGPMHIGAWGGTLTLNLSMGPVNAWETAPFPPGHLVLRPTASCHGCWSCQRVNHDAVPPCKARFVPERVASLVYAMLRGETRLPTPPGLELRRTRRSAQGLFDLEKISGNATSPATLSPRDALGEFWKQWFMERLGGDAVHATLPSALEALASIHPSGLDALRHQLPRFQARFAAALRRQALPSDFWRQAPPVLRPLTGYIQLLLENGDLKRPAWAEALAHMEHLAASFPS